MYSFPILKSSSHTTTLYSPNLLCTISARISAVPLTPSILESIMICLLSGSPGAY